MVRQVAAREGDVGEEEGVKKQQQEKPDPSCC